jgi:hypothetical protein
MVDALRLSTLIESGRAPNETIGFLAQQACEHLPAHSPS